MNKLVVSSSPHICAKDSVRSIMLDVIIALVPAGIAAVWLFGFRSLWLIFTCVSAAVLAEFISCKILKKENTTGDLSAVVTGLLLAYNLPVTLPLWMAVLGSVVAIVVVKQLFGGIGQNFVNPALIGRIFLMTSFATPMTTWTAPFTDAVSSATPLASMAADGMANVPSLVDMLIGNHGGCMGETCVIALVIGGIYLMARRVISPVIPLCYIGTVAVVMLFAGGGEYMLYQILSGGLLLGAIFMATDYTTSPVNLKGKIVYAVGCGLITVFIRLFGNMAEGVSYSIVIMNILTPHIENLTASKPFGFQRRKKQEAAK